MQTIRILWRSALLFLHLLLGILLTPLATRQDAQGYWLVDHRIAAWWLDWILRILGIAVTTSGSRPSPPALVVANHVSWLDIIVLGQLLPTCFLSKAEVRQWPLIGWLAKRAGTLFIRRGSGESASVNQGIATHLQHEGMLTLFPEGTTTDGRTLRPFFPRLFAAAIETGTPVAPVAIRYIDGGRRDELAPYTGEQTLMENLLGLLGRRGSQVRVHFCAPIPSEGAERKALAEKARAAIAQALDTL